MWITYNNKNSQIFIEKSKIFREIFRFLTGVKDFSVDNLDSKKIRINFLYED